MLLACLIFPLLTSERRKSCVSDFRSLWRYIAETLLIVDRFFGGCGNETGEVILISLNYGYGGNCCCLAGGGLSSVDDNESASC